MLAIVSSRLQGWKRAKKLWSFDCWRMLATREAGGGSGIRTRDTVSRIHTFQACAFNHSATPPAEPFGSGTLGSPWCGAGQVLRFCQRSARVSLNVGKRQDRTCDKLPGIAFANATKR